MSDKGFERKRGVQEGTCKMLIEKVEGMCTEVVRRKGLGNNEGGGKGDMEGGNSFIRGQSWKGGYSYLRTDCTQSIPRALSSLISEPQLAGAPPLQPTWSKHCSKPW